MPGKFDESTRQITLPLGDTFDIWVDVVWTALSPRRCDSVHDF